MRNPLRETFFCEVEQSYFHACTWCWCWRLMFFALLGGIFAGLMR